MRNVLIFTLAIALVGFAAVAYDGKDKKADSVTFDGEYDWSYGGSDTLSAEFKPKGDDEWKVTFRFRWSDRDHKWTGTAKGSLDNGTTVSGTATNGGRNWEWEATIADDGTMTGTHTELQGGGEKLETGTFSIKR